MKQFLLISFTFMIVAGLYSQSPTIDGDFDGVSVWGTSHSVADGVAGWSSANAMELYLVEDQDYIYVGANISSSTWMQWTFIINTTSGGASSDPWGRSIDYTHSNLPDYAIVGHFDGYSELRSWNGSGWDSTVLGNTEFGENIAGDNVNGWVEARVSKTNLGNPSQIDIQFYITGNSNDHGTFDAIPDDENAASWSVSPNTQLDSYANVYTLSNLLHGEKGIKILSNPSSNGKLEINNMTNQMLEFKIFNLGGVKLRSNKLQPNSQSIDLSNLPKGLYLLNVNDNSGSSLNLKFILN